MTTIEDIAEEADVSPSTVSRALNNSSLIGEETRRKVKRIAREMNYKKNDLASGLVKGVGVGALGLIIPNISNPYYAELTRGVQDRANELGYGVFLGDTEASLEKERRFETLLRRKKVDGIILASATVNDPYLKELNNSSVPIMLISRISRELETNFIKVDDIKGGRLAVEHLVELGHEKIGFIGGPDDFSSAQDRRVGFEKVMKEHGLPINRSIVSHAQYTQEAGHNMASAYISKQDKFTAIFCANDIIALGAIEALERDGLVVPEDVSIVGYDNISYASLPRIMLTTVSQPIYTMGYDAAESLIDISENEKEQSIQRELTPKLVVRNTTRKPKSG
ncbi:LacI family DNA-binding transcriptional regulator [Candidatus Bipolaricaulota bacterium]|nr:LacI family DNA-binding transcriptional regulator [Candidatus Bipolaricaulota bacterium]